MTDNDWFFELFPEGTFPHGSVACSICGRFSKIIDYADQGGIEIGAVYIINCKIHGKRYA